LGDALENGFFGGAGGDEIDGRGGNDAIFGDAGDDELYAGGGPRNALLGGRGSDFCQLSPGAGFVSSCERGPAGRAGTAAAAPVGFTSTFTAPNQVRARTIAVSPSAGSVQMLAAWRDPSASFGATVELVNRSGRTVARGLASVGKGRPRRVVKLRLKVTRGATYLAVEAPVPARLRSGKTPLKLRVKLRAKSVSRPTSVSTTIAQRRRR
jgi:hypothetical protein